MEWKLHHDIGSGDTRGTICTIVCLKRPCTEIPVILSGRFKESKRAADKIQTPCNQRLDAFPRVRGSSQIEGAFHSRLD